MEEAGIYIDKNKKIPVKKILFSLFIGVSILLFLFWILCFLQFTADDSFITYRYGKNLIESGIWNWNPDKNYVEAYTNFSYAFLNIIPEFLHISSSIFFKIFGLMLYFFMIFRLRKLIKSDFVFSVVLLALNITPFFFIHLYSGMETPFFIFLIFELGALLVQNQEGKEKYLFLIMLLLPLTRPEGILFSIAGLFIYLFINKRAIKSKTFLGAVILTGLLYMLWRISYFGYLLPNSFYVKSGFDHIPLSFMLFSLKSMLSYILILFLLLFLKGSKAIKFFIAASFLIILTLYSRSDLMMNYAGRFPFQITFPILIMSFLYFEKCKRNQALILLATALMIFTNIMDRNEIFYAMNYYPGLTMAHKDMALRLEKFKAKKYTLLVGDAGVIPYFSNWKSYDYIGLTDTYISHNKKIDENYVKNKNPDLILLYARADQSGALTLDDDYNQKNIMLYIMKSNDYQLISSSKWVNYYLVAFLKKSNKDFGGIAKELRANQNSSFKTPDKFFAHKDFWLQKYLFK